MGQIGPLKKKVESQGNEIDKLTKTNTDLKANVKFLLKKASLQDEEIVQLKVSSQELKTSNHELETSHQELKTKVVATSAWVSPTKCFRKCLIH